MTQGFFFFLAGKKKKSQTHPWDFGPRRGVQTLQSVQPQTRLAPKPQGAHGEPPSRGPADGIGPVDGIGHVTTCGCAGVRLPYLTAIVLPPRPCCRRASRARRLTGVEGGTRVTRKQLVLVRAEQAEAPARLARKPRQQR